jgi:hypothetical protein
MLSSASQSQQWTKICFHFRVKSGEEGRNKERGFHGWPAYAFSCLRLRRIAEETCSSCHAIFRQILECSVENSRRSRQSTRIYRVNAQARSSDTITARTYAGHCLTSTQQIHPCPGTLFGLYIIAEAKEDAHVFRSVEFLSLYTQS